MCKPYIFSTQSLIIYKIPSHISSFHHLPGRYSGFHGPVLFLVFSQTKKTARQKKTRQHPSIRTTPDCILDLAFPQSPEGTDILHHIPWRIHGTNGIFYLHENPKKSTIHVGKYTRQPWILWGMKTSDLVPFHLLFITCKITSHWYILGK